MSKTQGARVAPSVLVAAALTAAVARDVSVVSARVLVDHEPLGLKVGGIVKGTQAQIDALVAGGIADAHPEAVAYAAGSGGVVMPLVTEAAAAPVDEQLEAAAAVDAAASADAADAAAAAGAATDAAASDQGPAA